jgi:hypothetical protein
MTSKLHREHDAQAAMLACRTGLHAAICKSWIETPIAKSAEALQGAFMPDSDDNFITVARAEIEAYALARVKKFSRGESRLESSSASNADPLGQSIGRMQGRILGAGRWKSISTELGDGHEPRLRCTVLSRADCSFEAQCAWRRPLADAYTAEILSRPFVSSELAAALARHLRPAEILQA